MHERDDEPRTFQPGRPVNPPAISVPRVILVFLALMAGVHLLRTQLLDEVAAFRIFLDLAFISACYEGPVDICRFRSAGADVWTPVSHALLHGDWTHLVANSAWLLAFGTPVARRLGAVRFASFCLLGAAAGAALFYVLNPTLLAPMIGASGIVSAVMGGAARFALGPMRHLTSYHMRFAPRLTVRESLTDRTVFVFVAIFFVANLLIGSGVGAALGAQVQIAWEAHLGGFLFGFLLFGFFDPPFPK